MTSGSAAAGTGDNFTNTFNDLGISTNDLAGNARPSSGPWDMGVYAPAPSSCTLNVEGWDSMNSAGYVGGPFSPSSQRFELSVSDPNCAIEWEASATQDWVVLSSTSGTVRVGESAFVWVSINNTVAGTFTAGSYSGTVTFTNNTTHMGDTTRPVILTVVEPASISSVYGPGLNADGLNNTEVGRYNSQVSYRFRAPRSGTVDKVLVYHATGVSPPNSYYCYSPNFQFSTLIPTLLEVRTDDGSPAHLPSTTVLTSALNPDTYKSGDDSATWHWYEFGSTPVNVTAGTLYHLVFTNTHSDPRNNWCSLDGLWNEAKMPNMQPQFRDTDFAMLYHNDYLGWNTRYDATPVYNLHYSDGTAWGVGYVNAYSSSGPRTISGNSMVRETFTVSGGDKTASRVSARVRGSGTLTFRLEEGGGAIIEEGSVAGVSTGGKMQWVTYTFTQLRPMSNGQTYRLVLRSSSGSFTTFAMQKGNGYGFNAGYFTDSDPLGCQYNTGSGWTYESASSDLQFYFTSQTPLSCLLSITPDTGLISTGDVGGPFSPSSQSYTLQNSGTLSCDWIAAKQQNWVSLSGTSGSLASGASTTVTASINSSANSLGAGSYSDSVNFNWNTGSTTRSVGLTVNPPPAGLTVTPSSELASSGYTGGPFSPSSISYTLRNTGSTSINWTAAKGQNWVSLSPTNGTLTAGASRTVTASINSSANSLGAGSYSDTVTFTNTTNHIGDTTRPVSLTVTPAPCPLSINPSSLGFSGYQGGPFTPASLTYTLTTSGCTASWNTSGVPSWATLSPPSGSVTGSTTVTVSINSNANTLSPNTYPAAITFNNVGDPGGGTSASVNLTVNPPPLPDLRVTPAAGFDSSGVKGGPFSPPSTSYTLQNMGAGSLNWTAAKGQGWVDLSPTSGSLAAGASTTVTVSINANANNLAAGSHSDTITFTGGTGSITRSVNLSVRKDVYGGGINADSLDSVAIGKYGTDWPVVSYRFRAPHTGTIDSFAVYHSIGTGNAEGTGGVIVMEVRADEVSGDHVPSSTRLASAVNQSPISNGQVYTYVLDTPLSVTEGTIYHLVFTNTHPDPTNNWCSLHTIWNVSDTENMQPRFSDVDFACLLQYGAENPWEVRYSSTPVYNAHYTDGRMWGVGYVDVPISSMTRTVSGSSQVRQRFAVTGGDWVVSGISARVNGSGTLRFSLETGNGTLIEEGNVAGVSTGGAMQWVTYNLTTNRQLLNGQAYHLVLSAPSGSFTTFPMQKGDAYGLPAGDFPGGYFEYTGGSGWETSRTDTDLQSYFTVESHSPLAVTPATFTVTGYEGGPFNPSSQGYAVQNTTASQITWSASKTRNWVDLSPTGGTLAAGASTNVTVAINANANGLAAGDYGDTVTFTAGTISTTRPVSLAVRKDTYGSGLNADGTDSVAIGRYGADMPVVSYRFRAPHTGTIDKFLVYHNTDGGAGDGGIITMAVRNDDGSTDHLPSSGPPLATAVNQYARSNDSPYWYNLSTPIQVTAGRIYHLVFRNTHPNPATNWCSLVVLWNASETPGMQPRFSDLDFASLVQWGESNPLAVRYAGTPIYNAHYTNGTMWGVGYVNALISSMTKSISGANRVRERFTVAGGARVVSAVSARVNGSGTLTFRLERADGTLVEQGNVSGISTGGNMQWVTYNLTQNRTLSNGQAYRLILSASSGSFTTFPMQKGDAYGLTEGNFADGYFEYTNGSGWGTSRTDTDLQFYFAVE